MFVGRERELQKLESMYESDQFEFAVFYGRRRVGKTTLINEFCKNKKTMGASIGWLFREFCNPFFRYGI